MCVILSPSRTSKCPGCDTMRGVSAFFASTVACGSIFITGLASAFTSAFAGAALSLAPFASSPSQANNDIPAMKAATRWSGPNIAFRVVGSPFVDNQAPCRQGGGSAPRWYRSDVDDPEAARIDELLERHLGGDANGCRDRRARALPRGAPRICARRSTSRWRAGRWGTGGSSGCARTKRSRPWTAARVPGSSARWAWRCSWAAGGVSIPLPAVGLPMMGIGIILLMYSIIRVRLATHRDDPYKDIQR